MCFDARHQLMGVKPASDFDILSTGNFCFCCPFLREFSTKKIRCSCTNFVEGSGRTADKDLTIRAVSTESSCVFDYSVYGCNGERSMQFIIRNKIKSKAIVCPRAGQGPPRP